MACQPDDSHDVRPGFHRPCDVEPGWGVHTRRRPSALDPASVAPEASVGSGNYTAGNITAGLMPAQPAAKNPLFGMPYGPAVTSDDFVPLIVSKDQADLIKYLSVRYRSLAQEIEAYVPASANRTAALRALLESNFTVVHAISRSPEAKL